ncbi:MAG: pseudaminic acid synthase [Candidatus Sulfotelmatobacter sp.]
MRETKFPRSLKLGRREVGDGQPVYIVAELSANHNQNFDQAVRILRAAKDAGGDAVKLQTYTADTITLRSNRESFRIAGGTQWDGRTLHELYQEAFTPWEWQPKLKEIAGELGIDLFSSAFDETAVDFLEGMNVPAHKVASFELLDIGLIQKMARTGKPLILSTGMASADEITEAIEAARGAGATQIALLKCTSAYPASPEEANLLAIPELARRFGCPVGLSDHTMGIVVPVVAVALGACIIEKHLCLRRADGGPDGTFSLEPAEFKAMVEAVRTAEKALGAAQIGSGLQEANSRKFRRSLFAVEDIKKGELFTKLNVRSIRPADGLHPRHLIEVLGKRAACDVERGTPLNWALVVR